MSELSAVLTSTEESVSSTIATVATTLEQLKSKDDDSAQVGYEAVSATQVLTLRLRLAKARWTRPSMTRARSRLRGPILR